ncbi:SMI1/KNR4 family protein [Brevibacillus laterosporus]|uniref:SMI1/KNR4 family protein n=1 Tax=Brevibacillus laterosporus TaxID=1465 RepID=UPI001EF1EBB1|nr:SMI1/KNR4 family protein [Brevibacillus laterosporus]MCG7316159.1 SMI1/KNR4 family protein [Brevibacillus laterosporus]
MERIKWIVPKEPVEEKTISKVEMSLGIKFPRDYILSIMKFNGGYPEPNNFNFSDGGGAVFNNLLSFTIDTARIEETYDFLPKGIIPFARDPFGNLICFDYRKDKQFPTVVFFDHEEEGEDAIEPICDTFSELLDKLYSLEDEENETN